MLCFVRETEILPIIAIMDFYSKQTAKSGKVIGQRFLKKLIEGHNNKRTKIDLSDARQEMLILNFLRKLANSPIYNINSMIPALVKINKYISFQCVHNFNGIVFIISLRCMSHGIFLLHNFL